jgi:hypothetical protein
MRSHLVILFFVLIGICACEFNEPTVVEKNTANMNVLGWSDTRWGMTLSEVKRLYPAMDVNTTNLDGEHICKIQITRYPYDIYFKFNKARELERVTLLSDFYRIMPGVDICDISKNAYLDVIKSLKKHFGTPDKEIKENNDVYSAQLMWEYPSTIIESKPPSRVSDDFCPYTIVFTDNRTF